MFPCFQSCKGFGGISKPLWRGGRDGQASPPVMPLALLQWEGCPSRSGDLSGCPVGTRAAGPRAAEPFALGTSTLTRVRQGWPLHGFFSETPITFFLVAKILADLLEPSWRDGKHPMRLVGSHSWYRSQCSVKRAFMPWKTDRCKGGGKGSRMDTY